ncbi:putative ABC transport system permease protein [Lachnospiraceae bacterium]|nr:putative ABC transport system permease protein [Lachnospiraceae bacterium]
MLRENVKLALSALCANKLRSFLTMIGIIIGIASIIAIMTVSDAMNNSLKSSMGDMGANVMEFYLSEKPDPITGEYRSEVRKLKNSDYVTDEGLAEILKQFQGKIEGISLTNEAGNLKVTDQKKYANISLVGMNSTAITKKHLKLLSGRSFEKSEYQNAGKTAIVSDRYVNNMFDGDTESALGKTIEVELDNKYYQYTIVGVYEYQQSGGSQNTGNPKDVTTDVYIPLRTIAAQCKLLGQYTNFSILAAKDEDPEMLIYEIKDYINRRYYTNNDSFEIDGYSMKAELESMNDMMNTQKMAFVGIGALSLLVGGVGVMNIMIVSITERTREIGTRKALGATNGDIRFQFITESIIVCMIGGIIGIIAGLLLGLGISNAMNFKGTPSISGMIICVLFSVAFGVFFGFYPADRAAKMNPIEALRYE